VTPEQQQRADRLAARVNFYAKRGIAEVAYTLCLELEAIATAALAVRTFWGVELTDLNPALPLEKRLDILQTLTASVRITTMATNTMTVLHPLIRAQATKEVEHALALLARPNSLCGPDGIQRFCEQIAAGNPSADAATREMLQRIYDLSPNQPEDQADG